MDKYEIALKQARNYYPGNLFLDTIFPELAESEDERTRTQLVDFLEHLHSQGSTMDFDVWSKADCANWIVWLEKQKKQKDAERERLIKEAPVADVCEMRGSTGPFADYPFMLSLGFRKIPNIEYHGGKVRVIIEEIKE